MNLTLLFNENADFRLYVEKYCKKTNISVEEALTHVAVRLAAEYYTDEE